MTVHPAEDGMEIRPGNIYLGVSDRHLLLAGGRIRLGRGPRENMARPAIDPLFRSAAVAYCPRVVGVLLSGLLNDGASGVSAIKCCGGLALVQNPQDAIADEMPLAGLRVVSADLIAPGARIGDVLADLVRETAGPKMPIPPEIRLEVDIAPGERIDSEMLGRIADPAALADAVLPVQEIPPRLAALIEQTLSLRETVAVGEMMDAILALLRQRTGRISKATSLAPSCGGCSGGCRH
ncbi:MAG: chemotaxis protein CheB [Paracoccus sp. (in: a-proteobacteria)]|nr:chemotaxis protein CheB [Paracoccus sp. (in: a-proteobacteria)]MDO5370873.1 chemotaxis protein CheB [Paracoccus sp. (in: a-proteobacteria)]